MEKIINRCMSKVVDDERTATHVSLTGGKFYLNRGNKEDIFYKMYNTILRLNKENEKENKELIPLHLAEINCMKSAPLIIDVDIKIKKTDDKLVNLYEKSDAVKLIQLINKILIDKIEIKDKEHDLRGVILEKNSYFKSDYHKHGLHLHWPNILLDKDDISKVILPEIRKRIPESGAFGLVGLENVVIDDVCNKPWLLYGSFKPGCKPYYATNSFDEHGQLKIIYEAFHKNFNTSQKTIQQDLPKLLSILWTNPLIKGEKKRLICSNLKEIYSDIQFDLSEYICNEEGIDEKEDPDEYDPENVNDEKLKYFKIKKILSMLDKSRASSYQTWWEIGIILFNEGKGSELYLNLWKQFSKLDPKYDGSDCDHYWYQMESKQNNLKKKKSFGSLMFLAKQDNKNFNKDYLEVEINPFDDESMLYIPPTETKIGKMIYRLLAGNYLYDVANNLWYIYSNPCWVPCKKISTILIPEFEKISSYYKIRIGKIIKNLNTKKYTYNQKLESAKADKKTKKVEKYKNTCKKAENTIKTYNKCLSFLQKKLENTAGIKNIINILESYYSKQDVEFDKSPNLIAFENGVFDCIKKEFRIGYPTDMISKKIATKYNSELTLESPSVKNVINFFSEIFPDEDIRNYFLQTNSDFLFGKNQRKLCIWKGDGANGKSLTQKVYEKMIHGLTAKIPKSTVCIGSNNSSAPSPELARLDGGVRWVVTDEVKKGEDVLSASKICQLTGDDSIYARGLYQQGKEIDPMFQLNILCNSLPVIQSADDATWDRIKVIPFKSKFVNDTTKYDNKKYIFKKDPHFDIKPLLEPLLWMTVNLFKNPLLNVLDNPPNDVIEAVNQYKKNNCVVKQFLMDEFAETENESDIVFPNYCYLEFKNWFNENFPQTIKNNITKPEFIDIFKQVFSHKLRGEKGDKARGLIFFRNNIQAADT